MTTQVSKPKNFSLHGYWIEHKLDDEGEVSMGVDVYQTVDPYADPCPSTRTPHKNWTHPRERVGP